MSTRLLGPGDVHIADCRTEASYRREHAKAIAGLAAYWSQRNGTVPSVRRSTAATVAYVNEGRWLVDCVCNNGVAVHPDWGIGCCFSCGRIHDNITFPTNRADIENALMNRARVSRRNWTTETVEQLNAEPD